MKRIVWLLTSLVFLISSNHLYAKEEVKLLHFRASPEAEHLEVLADYYNKKFPGVPIVMEGIADGFNEALKVRYAANTPPAAHLNGGGTELDLFHKHLEDLSDQEWVKNALDGTLDQFTRDGKIYAAPYSIEGYGMIYNPDIFEKVGITDLPDTLPELRGAAEKIKQAGITPFSNGFKALWVLGAHNFNMPLALQPDPNQFIKDLNAGKAKFTDNKVFDEWFGFLDLVIEYGNKDSLATTWLKQQTMFANLEVAMTKQGNWATGSILKVNSNVNMGFLPISLNSEPGKVYFGVPGGWSVDKNSPYKERAKHFINWMYTSDYGTKWTTEKLRAIPAYENIEGRSEEIGQLGTSLLQHIKAGRGKGWYWLGFPQGFTDRVGQAMQSYVAKVIDKAELLQAIQDEYEDLTNP